MISFSGKERYPSLSICRTKIIVVISYCLEIYRFNYWASLQEMLTLIEYLELSKSKHSIKHCY